jgi:hypothetical protein
MNPVPVTIDNPYKQLNIKIFPDKTYKNYRVGFSIPLSHRKELYLEISEKGEYLKAMELINENGDRTALVTSDSWLFSLEPDAVDLWNSVRSMLSRKTGAELDVKPQTREEVMVQIHSLLLQLRLIFSTADQEDFKSDGRYSSYEMYAGLGDALSGIPSSPKGMNADRLLNTYKNSSLYSSPDMFSPPSERREHVLRFELTQGCDFNGCTYCTGYKGVQYKEKSIGEFRDHYKSVIGKLGDYTDNVSRVFIGGGNAMSIDLDTLKQATRFLNNNLNPSRIATYGRADSISKKGKAGIEELRNAGLNLTFCGLESGSQEVLDYTNKRITLDQMLLAGQVSSAAKMDLSVMVIPGLGGMRYSQSHIDGTVALLNAIPTAFITFMGIKATEKSAYSMRMKKEQEEGINRPLTDWEMVQQLKAILSGLDPKGQKIGVFDYTIDKVGHNPINFNQTFDERGKWVSMNECDKYFRGR